MNEDQGYYDYLLERQAPRLPQDAVELAQAPSQTMTDAAPVAAGTVRPGAMQAEMSAIPRQPVVGAIADFVRKVREFGDQYEVQDWVPLLGGASVGDLFIGKSPEEIENWAYGNLPMQIPEMSNVPIMKTGRKQPVADTAFLGMDVSVLPGLAKQTGKLGLKAGKAIAEDIATTPPTGGAVGISPTTAKVPKKKGAK